MDEATWLNIQAAASEEVQKVETKRAAQRESAGESGTVMPSA